MKESAAELLKDVQTKIIMFSLLSMPGSILVGLGLLGIFKKDAGEIHPVLNNMSVVYLMLGVGIVCTIWCVSKLHPLEKEKNRLKKLV